MKTLLALLLLPGLAGAATVSEWRLPAPAGASQPNLSVAPDGGLYLSDDFSGTVYYLSPPAP